MTNPAKQKLRNRLLTILLPTVLVAAVTMAVIPGEAEGQASTADYGNPLQALNQAFIDVSANVQPAVVTVSTARVYTQRFNNPFGSPFSNDDFFNFFFGPNQRPRQQQPQEREYVQQGLGSGVLVSEDGYIVTNNHVIDEADSIFVRTQDGERFAAEVIGADPKTDIAVLKIEADNLEFLQFGSSDDLRVGEIVFAVGSPMSENLAYTVTQGIVSAKGRSNVGLAEYEDFIQTDAAINPGNSGGPLVNLNGEIVGINTAIASRTGGFQGIGFAVPARMAQDIMRSLIDDGRVVRGWLGVYIQDLSPEMAQAFGSKDARGALVSEVMPDSPADKGGLESGDIILQLDGREIRNTNELRSRVAAVDPGTNVKVLVLREGDEKNLSVKLGELPDETIAAVPNEDIRARLGCDLVTFDNRTAQQYGIDRKLAGVVVTQVEPGSRAIVSGLAEGDLITSVSRKPIKNLEEFLEIVGEAEEGSTVLLNVVRDGRRLYVALAL